MLLVLIWLYIDSRFLLILVVACLLKNIIPYYTKTLLLVPTVLKGVSTTVWQPATYCDSLYCHYSSLLLFIVDYYYTLSRGREGGAWRGRTPKNSTTSAGAGPEKCWCFDNKNSRHQKYCKQINMELYCSVQTNIEFVSCNSYSYFQLKLRG